MHLKSILLGVAMLLVATAARGADPTATRYSAADCQGTARPYPAAVDPAACAVPDSLEAVFINHVGRHGSRFIAGEKQLTLVEEALGRAREAGSITRQGQALLRLCADIRARVDGRWGALDSLGAQEERLIASRMAAVFPELVRDGRVTAISSYSPRCIMSMYEFAHQLSRLDNSVEIATSSGRQHSALMRPFDSDADYTEYRDSRAYDTPLYEEARRSLPVAPLQRVLGESYELPDDIRARYELAMAMWTVVASTDAQGLGVQLEKWFKPEEYNALWALSNLSRYLRYSASTLSAAAPDMAGQLLLELVTTTDAAAQGQAPADIMLRFGHAETLMPLLALMHLPGCYYMTNYFDTVAQHWRDFSIVPMAANVRLVLLRHRQSGELYLRADLNEQPVPLVPGRSAIYTPWSTARSYLVRCLPLLLQP